MTGLTTVGYGDIVPKTIRRYIYFHLLLSGNDHCHDLDDYRCRILFRSNWNINISPRQYGLKVKYYLEKSCNHVRILPRDEDKERSLRKNEKST